MGTGKQAYTPTERHIFTPEELERMKKHLELLTGREELIGCLDGYSSSFAGWSILINEAVQEMIVKKQQLNVDCEKEREMLGNISFLLTKMAYFSGMLSDWHKELAFSRENTVEMIEQGHP